MPHDSIYSEFQGFYYRHITTVGYSHFQDAGLDLFCSGPNQNPQAFLQLTNILPSMTGGFRRRWGVSTLCTLADGSFVPVRAFSYNAAQDASDSTDTTATNLILTTDNTGFQVVDIATNGSGITGTAYSGFKPSNFTSAGSVYGIESRQWFYYCNGNQLPRKLRLNYTTKNTECNWGFNPPSAFFAPSTNNSGTSSTTTSTGLTTQQTLDGATLVSGSTAVQAATSTISALGGTGSGYTHATVTISGGGGTGAAATAVIKDGMITGFEMTNIGAAVTSTAPGYTTTPSVEISGDGTGALGYAVIQNGYVVDVLPGGPMQFNQGRTYTYAWQNSFTGHTSDIAQGITVGSVLETYAGNAVTVLAPNLGVSGLVPYGVGFTQIQITIKPVKPIDPQVDTCLILATSDGGDLENLYQVAQLAIDPNNILTITFIDKMPDTVTESGSQASVSSYTIGLLNGTVNASIYTNVGDKFTQTSSSTPVFTQTFNSLMFNTHPESLLPNFTSDTGIDAGSANQTRPFTNQVINSYGQWSSDMPVESGSNQAGNGSLGVFDMILQGTFVVTAATTISFESYCNALFMLAIGGGVSLVSGPAYFGTSPAYTTSPLSGLPMITGINDAGYPTQGSNVQTNTSVISFPSAGNYPFEICFTGGFFSEKSFNLMANNQVLVAANGVAALNNLTSILYLLNQNKWVDSDSYGNITGIIGNTPPPSTLLYPTPHQGRLFATDGKTIFFSKSIDEVTTSTSLITSKWEECWPAENQLPIALDNEEITGLVSDGQTLHIGTTKSIYAMYGDSPGNFSIPSYLFQETGVLSMDTWTVVYSQGQPAGYMWITPDYKVMFSNFTTYNQVGDQIYPLLLKWDSSYTTQAKLNSFSYGPYNFCVLSFRQLGNPVAQFLVYETSLHVWYNWIPALSSVSALSAFVYQHPPNGYRGLFYCDQASASSNYRFFDPSQTTNDLGTPFNWAIQTSWQDLGDPHSIKWLNEMTLWTDEPTQTITLWGANSQQEIDSPVQLKTGTPVLGPLGAYKFYCAGAPTKARLYSFEFNSGTIAGPEVLSAFDVQYYPVARL